jgi:hypothetical protein
MVTHYRANFIMLISNLPSVRSFACRDTKRTWGEEGGGSGEERFVFLLSFFLSFSLSLSSVTPCPSFCQTRPPFRSRICTATKTTTMTVVSFAARFLFVLTYTHIRLVRSPTTFTQVKRKKGRGEGGSHLCHYGN